MHSTGAHGGTTEPGQVLRWDHTWPFCGTAILSGWWFESHQYKHMHLKSFWFLKPPNCISFLGYISKSYHIWLVVWRPPLWKMMDFVSWDDESPKIVMGKYEKHGETWQPVTIQSPPSSSHRRFSSSSWGYPLVIIHFGLGCSMMFHEINEIFTKQLHHLGSHKILALTLTHLDPGPSLGVGNSRVSAP